MGDSGDPKITLSRDTEVCNLGLEILCSEDPQNVFRIN
jgi:hypothetical protein